MAANKKAKASFTQYCIEFYEKKEIKFMSLVKWSMIKAEPPNHFRGRHPLFKQEQRRILGADADIK